MQTSGDKVKKGQLPDFPGSSCMTVVGSEMLRNGQVNQPTWIRLSMHSTCWRQNWRENAPRTSRNWRLWGPGRASPGIKPSFRWSGLVFTIFNVPQYFCSLKKWEVHLFHFRSIVGLCRAKMITIVSMYQYLRTWQRKKIFCCILIVYLYIYLPTNHTYTHKYIYTYTYFQRSYTCIRDLRTSRFLTCLRGLGAEHECETRPSGRYMNHMHYIIEWESAVERWTCSNWGSAFPSVSFQYHKLKLLQFIYRRAQTLTLFKHLSEKRY